MFFHTKLSETQGCIPHGLTGFGNYCLHWMSWGAERSQFIFIRLCKRRILMIWAAVTYTRVLFLKDGSKKLRQIKKTQAKCKLHEFWVRNPTAAEMLRGYFQVIVHNILNKDNKNVPDQTKTVWQFVFFIWQETGYKLKSRMSPSAPKDCETFRCILFSYYIKDYPESVVFSRIKTQFPMSIIPQCGKNVTLANLCLCFGAYWLFGRMQSVQMMGLWEKLKIFYNFKLIFLFKNSFFYLT